MITLQLDEDQAGFLEAALEKAMDNEGDSEYYEAFDQLIGMLREEIHNVDLLIEEIYNA